MLENDVKNHLRLTEDDEIDIKSLIERGKRYLCNLTGTSLNFDEEDLPKQLLMDYCRYDFNNALEYFKDNFREDILLLILREGVKDMKENEENVK